jgi:hypothetical protein
VKIVSRLLIKTIALSLVFVTLVSACSAPSPFAQLVNGNCTAPQEKLISAHISGQIDAFVMRDFKKAYSYAAESFQQSIDVDDFELIIKAQYQVLLNSKGINFGECQIIDQEINQDVVVTSGGKDLPLLYRLTYVNNRLGVIAATVTSAPSTVTT